MFNFSNISMYQILDKLSNIKEQKFQIKALNPDISSGKYVGENVYINEKQYIHRSLKSWLNLADIIGYRLLIPKVIDNNFILLTYERLSDDTFHKVKISTEKYGTKSKFSKINKMQEPSFLYHYIQSLNEVKVETRKNILNIGINQGDEFITIKEHTKNHFNNLKLTGIDYSKSAIESAKKRLNYDNCTLHCHDINKMQELDLNKFDLIISIGTLQTRTIDTKVVVMKLIQNYLNKDGAIIFGFPNGRWKNGELIYGAEVPNYTYPEMSLILKDIHWIKKYLQQKKFRVTVIGKEYLFLRAVKV